MCVIAGWRMRQPEIHTIKASICHDRDRPRP
jgi:hypothetical protein